MCLHLLYFADFLFRDILEAHSPSNPHMILGDAALALNLPFPSLLRNQRGVDIILSFDFGLPAGKSSLRVGVYLYHFQILEWIMTKNILVF